jgi:hypothetical protein
MGLRITFTIVVLVLALLVVLAADALLHFNLSALQGPRHLEATIS